MNRTLPKNSLTRVNMHLGTFNSITFFVLMLRCEEMPLCRVMQRKLKAKPLQLLLLQASSLG